MSVVRTPTGKILMKHSIQRVSLKLKTCVIIDLFPLFSTTNTQPPTHAPNLPTTRYFHCDHRGPSSHLNMAEPPPWPPDFTSASIQSVLHPVARMLSVKSKLDHPYFWNSMSTSYTWNKISSPSMDFQAWYTLAPAYPFPLTSSQFHLLILCTPATWAFFWSLIMPNSLPMSFLHHSFYLDMPPDCRVSAPVSPPQRTFLNITSKELPSPPPVSIFHSTFFRPFIIMWNGLVHLPTCFLPHANIQAFTGPCWIRISENIVWNIVGTQQIIFKSVMEVMRWAGTRFIPAAQRKGEQIFQWPFEWLGLCSPWNNKVKFVKLLTPSISISWGKWRLQKALRGRGGVQVDFTEVNTQIIQCQDDFLDPRKRKAQDPKI